MTVRALPLAAALFAAHALADDAGGNAVEQAFATARARHQPVLVDFHAPWCYSCYYMKKNVLDGAPWERVEREATVVELDADSPEGAHWMAEWHVKAMPTYLLFTADGQELGRVLGEQTRGDFYGWLFPLMEHGGTLAAVKARAVDDSAASIVAARDVLRAYHERYDPGGGLAWYASAPPALKSAIARDAAAGTWVARLELQRSVMEKDAAGCMNVAPMVLGASLGCERPYEVAKVLACTEGQSREARRKLLKPQAQDLQLLVDKRVLQGASRCADEQSIVVAAADVYEELGEAAAGKRVLDQAIDDLQKRIGGDLRKDRNLSDNLRVYLQRAGRAAELDALLLGLIDAYPGDYVYAYRYGKILAARGRHPEALKYFEQAAQKAYGVNALRNAEQRALSLRALKREPEAREVLAAALKDNGAWFPEDAGRVKALLDSLPAA